MKMFDLTGPALLDPFWFQMVRQGKHAAQVLTDGSVTVEGVPLHLRGERPAPGTEVRVWLNASGFFVCATAADVEQSIQERQEALEREAAQRRERLNIMRAADEAFNARISIPVKWDVGIKDVLSGLSATSWGDGRSRSTVEHVLLHEDLRDGRLVRAQGDFLCTATSGSNGKRWASQVTHRAVDGDGQPYAPRVTCKACLTIAARWAR